MLCFTDRSYKWLHRSCFLLLRSSHRCDCKHCLYLFLCSEKQIFEYIFFILYIFLNLDIFLHRSFDTKIFRHSFDGHLYKYSFSHLCGKKMSYPDIKWQLMFLFARWICGGCWCWWRALQCRSTFGLCRSKTQKRLFFYIFRARPVRFGQGAR